MATQGIIADHPGALLSAVILLASSIWLFAGSSRHAAVLAGRTDRQVERATAVGFFFGLTAGLLVLATDFPG